MALLSGTQAFIIRLEEREPALFTFLLSSHPKMLDSTYADLSNKVIIDLIEVTGHMVNPMDAPEQFRSNFMMQTPVSQAKHLHRTGLYDAMLDKFDEFLRGSQWDRKDVLMKLGKKGYRGSIVRVPVRDLKEEAVNPELNSW